MAINFAAGVKTSQDAEQLLQGAPAGAYVAWRVPFEQDSFRLTYVTEEGSVSAPRRVTKYGFPHLSGLNRIFSAGILYV
jgi:hypothetical protein